MFFYFSSRLKTVRQLLCFCILLTYTQIWPEQLEQQDKVEILDLQGIMNKDWEKAVNDILSNQHSDREKMTATVNKLKADLEQRDQLIVCKDKELEEKMEKMRQRDKEMKKVMREKTNLERKHTRKEVRDKIFDVLIKLVKRQKIVIEKLYKKGRQHY